MVLLLNTINRKIYHLNRTRNITHFRMISEILNYICFNFSALSFGMFATRDFQLVLFFFFFLFLPVTCTPLCFTHHMHLCSKFSYFSFFFSSFANIFLYKYFLVNFCCIVNCSCCNLLCWFSAPSSPCSQFSLHVPTQLDSLPIDLLQVLLLLLLLLN